MAQKKKAAPKKPAVPKKTADAIEKAAEKVADSSPLQQRKNGLVRSRLQMKENLEFHRNKVAELTKNLDANEGAILLIDEMIAEEKNAEEKA
jgi:hypothetical protein